VLGVPRQARQLDDWSRIVFDRVKTVVLDDMGREIVSWHGSKDDPANLRNVALKLLEDHPHGVIEIRYVR
jgi:hypothetical protein